MLFSDREASILLDATLMHGGVPFRCASKRAFSEHQQSSIDQASERLAALRATHRQRQGDDVDLTDSEVALLVDVVEDCLKECGNDVVELRWQLHTGDRREVEALMERLRTSLQESRQISRD